MQPPINIRHVFAPLGFRLFLFESKAYIDNYVDYIEDVVYDKMDEEFEHIISSIGEQINYFDDDEVISQIDYYVNRVVNIVNGLQPRVEEYLFEKGNVIKKSTTEDRKNKLLKSWKYELYSYLYHLNLMKSVRRSQASPETKDAVLAEKEKYQITIFNLPEKLDFKLFHEKFSPYLTVKQVGLFLFYLKEEGIMPNYEKSSFARIAEWFFGRHKQGVRVNIPDYSTEEKNKKDLEVIENALKRILVTLAKDLKSAT